MQLMGSFNSTAVGLERRAATLAPRFHPEQLMRYHLSLSLMDSLLHNGILTLDEHAAACKKLSEHFGLPEDLQQHKAA